MNRIWYLSPSSQYANVGIDGYGTEQEQMRKLVHEITPHLDRAGVSFCVARSDMTLMSRVTESNSVHACFHLALHSNAGGNGKAYGPVALYYSDAGKAFGDKLIAALLGLGQASNRSSHLVQNKTLYELRRTQAPACLLEVDFHDSSAGVAFLTKRRAEIAEAIAKVIIEADGKEFVPVTSGEYVDEAIRLGLFSHGYNWKGYLTREEAAKLAVNLIALVNKGGEMT